LATLTCGRAVAVPVATLLSDERAGPEDAAAGPKLRSRPAWISHLGRGEMRMLNALAVLLVFQLIGEVLAQWMELPIPGPLIGMLLLFALLTVRRSVPDWLRDTATGLLQHLMLLFIPAVTGVILYFEQLGDDWVAFVVASVLGTAISIVVTAVTLRLMLARRKLPTP
jgi:putative effector of murein hydrolase LrgA (UPF0299 family)